MSVASTTIAQGAFGDSRVLYLAQLAGYADGVDTALGKLARLWGRCTYLQTDVLPVREVRACLGPQGDEHLVEAGLGELVEGGVRVKGRFDNASGRDRFAWYAETPAKKDGRSAGGRARVAGAKRGPDGKFAGAVAGPANGQQIHQQTSNVEPASDLLDVAGRVAGTSKNQQPDGGGSAAGPANQQSQLQVQVQDQDQSSSRDPDRGNHPSGADPDRGGGLDLVQPGRFTALVNRFLSRVNAARVEVATKHNLGPVRPVHLMGNGGGGERDLVARFTASADPTGDLEHVLDVAIAEAGVKGELRWLSWSVASEKAWRACLASTVQEVTRRRPRGRGPGSAAPRADHGTESADCSEVFG